MLASLLFSTPKPKRTFNSSQRATRSFLAGSVCLSLFALVACDRGQGPEAPSSAGSASHASDSANASDASDASDASNASNASAVDRTSPSALARAASGADGIWGGADPDAHPDRVTLEARYTPRAQLMKQLSARYGFKVLGRASGEAKIDIDVTDVPIEAALAVLLEGQPYALQYAASAVPHRKVEMVLLGSTEQHLNTLRSAKMAERRKAKGQEITRERKRERSARQETLAALAPEEREAFLEREAEEKKAERQERAERARAQLYSNDPGERARAIQQLDKNTVSIAEIAEIAQRDPVASVRASAISKLGKSDSPAAEASVVSALDDSDPAVVIEAIEALEWKDRRSDIPKITPFLEHENNEVRAAAEGAIEFIGL